MTAEFPDSPVSNMGVVTMDASKGYIKGKERREGARVGLGQGIS